MLIYVMIIFSVVPVSTTRSTNFNNSTVATIKPTNRVTTTPVPGITLIIFNVTLITLLVTLITFLVTLTYVSCYTNCVSYYTN